MAQARVQGTAFAKTTRPVIGAAIRREALFGRLDGRPGRTGAWIHGPAGAGKSTLAASYVEARNLQCVWYHIDPDDADGTTFFRFLHHAARKLDGYRERALPEIRSERSTDTAAFARKFFRALFACARTPAAIVFDNMVETSAALLAAVEAAFSEVPKHCCLLVTSRSAPPASLARRQVSGELVCIGGAELRFEPGDLIEIGRLRGLPIEPATAERLHERTQGWIAAIVLMMEHAKLAGHLADLPEDAAPKVVFDYLAGEIFDRFEQATQQFLTRVVRLPRVSVQVAEILTGEKRAGRLLRNLAHNDYFVREVRSEEGLMYTIHPLLRDFLRERDGETLDADAIERCKRAARHLLDGGQAEDAVHLLAACADWEGIASVACDHGAALLAEGRGALLQRWIELLPSAVLEHDARLLYVAALPLTRSSPRTARRRLEQAFAVFSAAGDRPQMLACCRAIVDALLAELDDLTALDPWIDRLQALLSETKQLTETDEATALATLIGAMIARTPNRLAATGWLERAASLLRQPSVPTRVAHRLRLSRVLALLASGEIARAKSVLEELAASPQEAIADPATAFAKGLFQLLDADAAAALETADTGRKSAAGEGVRPYDVALAALAGLASISDTAGMRAKPAAPELATAAMRRGDRALLHWLRSHVFDDAGDTASASAEAREALALAVETGMPWLELLVHIELTQLHMLRGDREDAAGALRQAASLAERLGCPTFDMTVALLRAALAHQGDDAIARTNALREALAIGSARGCKHVPLIHSDSVATLCAFALRDGIEPEYARSLVRSSKMVAPAMGLRLRQWPWRFRVRTMGSFEIRRGDMPIAFAAKGPGRPIELLKVLIALGGHNVRTDQIGDLLWPRVDADYAHKSFTIALHRLRRILDDESLILREARLTLNRALVWVDSWALDELLKTLDDGLRDPGQSADAVLRQGHDELFDLYPGPFLRDESEHPAFIASREQTRTRIARVLMRAIRRGADAAALDMAEECYLRLIDADELCEALHRGLMQLYQRRGDRVEALATYERLRSLLATRLGASPSAETQAAFAEIGAM